MSSSINHLIHTNRNLPKTSLSPITVSFSLSPEKLPQTSSSTSIVNVTTIPTHVKSNSDSEILKQQNSLGLFDSVPNESLESNELNKSKTALDLIKTIQQTHCSNSQPPSPEVKEETVPSFTESLSWIKGFFNSSVESFNGFRVYTPSSSMEGISGTIISQYFNPSKNPTESPAILTGLVFGVPLQIATLNSLLTRDVPLPAIVIRCVEYLDNYGLNEIGLYRIPGGTSEVLQLRNQFDCGSDLDLSIDPPDPNAVATLFKSFLRELPESILTPKIFKTIQNFMSHYHSAAINSTTVPKIGNMAGERIGGTNPHQLPSHLDPKSRALAEDIGNLVSELPDCNYYLLHWLMRHLARVDSNHQINKMSTSNLSVIFCPTLGIPSNLFKLMVDFNHIIFPLPKPSSGKAKGTTKLKSPRPFSASSVSDHQSGKGSISSIGSGIDQFRLKKLDPLNYFGYKSPSPGSTNAPSSRNSQDSQRLPRTSIDSVERFKVRTRKQNQNGRGISPRMYRDFTIVGDMFNIKNPALLFGSQQSKESNPGSMKSEVSVKSRNSILSYQSTSINTYPKLTETLQRTKSRDNQRGRESHASLEEILKPFEDLKDQQETQPPNTSEVPKDLNQVNLEDFATPSTIYCTPASTRISNDILETPTQGKLDSPKQFDQSQFDTSAILNLFPRVHSRSNSRPNSRKGSFVGNTSSGSNTNTGSKDIASAKVNSPAQQKLRAMTPPTSRTIPTTPISDNTTPDDVLVQLRQGLKKTGIKIVADEEEQSTIDQ